MYLTRTAFNSVQLDPCRQLLSTEPSFKIQSSLSHLKNLIVYLRYLTARWQAQIASNPRTSFLSMWCRLNLEFPFHDSTPRVRDLAWSAILKKNRDCAERSEVRESRTVKLEPARALDPRRWPRGSQLWERECICGFYEFFYFGDFQLQTYTVFTRISAALDLSNHAKFQHIMKNL